MKKQFMAVAALAVTTFTAGLMGNVANASQAPAPKPPIVQQQDKKDVKPAKAEPQKKADIHFNTSFNTSPNARVRLLY